jgi:GTPase SAR1 family protein
LNKAPDRREEKLPILLVGGKKDLALEGKRVVEEGYASELGKKFGVFDFIECSSKTGENVDLIFSVIALEMLKSSGLL